MDNDDRDYPRDFRWEETGRYWFLHTTTCPQCGHSQEHAWHTRPEEETAYVDCGECGHKGTLLLKVSPPMWFSDIPGDD